MNNGWIKIHRDMLDWEWYTDLPVKTVFLHLLLRANHEDKKWQGLVIGRGQLVCSAGKLGKECGLSRQQVRGALAKLKANQQITSRATNKYTVVTVVNYDKYQDNVTSKQPATQPSNNHKQELKEVKNINNTPLTPHGGSDGKVKKSKREQYFLTTDQCFAEIGQITKEPEIRAAAAEWVKMRYANKRPLTREAIRRTFGKIRGFNYRKSQVVACFEQSVDNCWTGVFEIKG